MIHLITIKLIKVWAKPISQAGRVKLNQLCDVLSIYYSVSLQKMITPMEIMLEDKTFSPVL